MNNEPQRRRHPGLLFDVILFETLLAELARRGAGRREAGAFLLATAQTPTDLADSDPQPVEAIAYYDDLDPACLTGGITFGATGYSALGDLCRRDNLLVVGDIHTHPSSWVSQSKIDANHPMAAVPGHIALIAPHFAQGHAAPDDLGVHIFAGAGQWESHYGAAAAALIHLADPVVPRFTRSTTWRPPIQWILRWHRQHLPWRRRP